MFFLPQILLTGNLFQLNVRIFCFGLGVSREGKWVGVVGPGGGGGAPPILRGPPPGGGGGGGGPPPGGGGGGGIPPGGGGGGGIPPGGGGGGGIAPPGGGGGGGIPPGGGGGAGIPLGGGGGGGGGIPPGGGGGGGGITPVGVVALSCWFSALYFLRPLSTDLSLCRLLCWLGALSSLWESSLFSRRVARCTNLSAVSQIRSLTGSFGSIRKRCCKMLKKGISWGVSNTVFKME